MRAARKLGVWSGVGVNIGATIGVGVFASAGFMADTMTPAAIMVAWIAGGVLAIVGARAYAEVATIVPRGGGEYRFLSELFHPWLGCLAGWTSLLAGFAAPVAADAKIMVGFAETLAPGVDLTHVGAGVIVVVTLLHALDLTVSHGAQNVLAIAKAVLLAGFVGAGLLFGAHALPDYRPAHAPAGGAMTGFMSQLVFVVYAYIGWNSAAYAADEFVAPRRTVPRTMVISAVVVMTIYLVVNWIFVVNLDPATVAAFKASDTSRVTFAHLIMGRLVGATGAKVMSVLVVVTLASAISSLSFVGPRVYQAMARDGYMPRGFAGAADASRPPVFSVLLQGGLALAVYYTHGVADVMGDVAVVLTVASALTVATLWKVRFDARHAGERPGALSLLCAAAFIVGSVWLVVYQIKLAVTGNLGIWIAGLLAASTVGYLAAGGRRVP